MTNLSFVLVWLQSVGEILCHAFVRLSSVVSTGEIIVLDAMMSTRAPTATNADGKKNDDDEWAIVVVVVVLSL